MDNSYDVNIPEKQWHRQVLNWLDQRTGINLLLKKSLDEPIPGGARWAYVFGSGLLFLFLSQVITGVFLTLYYVPSADHAHTTVAYITKEVTAGSLLRSVHSYGSSVIVIVLMMHFSQVFLFGSYKGRRELLWVSGCFLAVLMIGMAFTGYLLPWDQKAYFATAVGTNIISEIPLVGELLKRLVRGGAEMGTLTVSRFFVAHILLIPGLIFGLIAIHVYLFRKAGAAGPINADPIQPQQPTEKFYTRQIFMDLGFALILIIALGLLAHFKPVELGPKANPADTQYLPRPEWYYTPMFQWLKYWNGRWAIVGILVIPSLLSTLVASLPFFDRKPERRPWKRPLAVSVFSVIILALIGLGILSYLDDKDPNVASQLARQNQETDQFMQSPFEPEVTKSSSPGGTVISPDRQLMQGKSLYETNSCNVCHGDNGMGTPAGPALVRIGGKYSSEQLIILIRQPTQAMRAGGMSPINLSDDEMKSLIGYLNGLK